MRYRLSVALGMLLAVSTAAHAANDAVITGRVVDDAGKPVPGIKLYTDYVGDTPVLSGADGKYRLSGWLPGRRVVRAEDTMGQTVAMPLVNVTTVAGETTTAPDVVMTAGGIVEGTVTDAGTGQPLSDTSVGLYSPNGLDLLRTAPRTDAQGHFALRVPPGHVYVKVLDRPPGFLADQDGNALVVAIGTTQKLALQLSHGQAVNGVVVDTDNRPVGGLHLQFTVRTGRSDYSRAVRSGDDGAWSQDGLPAGEVTINVPLAANLELVGPKTFTLPSAQPIHIVVRKVSTLPLRGRVVTTAGAPVAHLPLNVSIEVKIAANGTSISSQSYSTDATGRLDMADVRADAQVTVGRLYRGYRYRSGGVVVRQEGALVMSDLVLAPLTARLDGTVVDGATPVAGATVVSPDGEAGDSAVTDAQGHFTLKSLPEGQATVTVLAAYHGHYAEAHANVADAVELRLAPLPAVPQPDLERGYALLQKLWEAGPQGVVERDEKLYQTLQELWPGTSAGRYRTTIPVALAVAHPDLALKLVSQSDAITHDAVLAQIVTTLAAQDPVLAATWAPPKLALFQDRDRGIAPTLTLALAIADVAPDTARPLYQQVRDYVKAHSNDDVLAAEIRPVWLARLALLAVRVDPAAVHDLENEALAQARVLRQVRRSVTPILIAVHPDQCDALLNDLTSRERIAALAAAAPLVVMCDLAQAQRWLDQLREGDDSPGTSSYRRALLSCLNAVGPLHPDQAMALASRARPEQNRDEVLLTAAQFQARDQALVLLRQVSTVDTRQPVGPVGMFMSPLRSYGSGSADALWRVASLTYDGDKEKGETLFADYKLHLVQQLANRGRSMTYGGGFMSMMPGASVASFAYYYSRVDPAESRLWLEGAFADASRRMHAAHGSADDYSPFQNNELVAIVTAMAAIDTDRALAMAASLTLDGQRPMVRYGPSPQMAAYAKIGEYLTTSESQRRLRPFMQWSGATNPGLVF